LAWSGVGFPGLKEGLAERELYGLNPRLETEGPGFKDKFLRWGLYSWAGKTYGIDQGLSLCVYYYRQDIFEQAGLDPNTFETYDNFIRAGQILKAKTGSYLTITETASSTYPSLFLLQNDGGLFDQYGEVLLDSPQIISKNWLENARMTSRQPSEPPKRPIRPRAVPGRRGQCLYL